VKWLAQSAKRNSDARLDFQPANKDAESRGRIARSGAKLVIIGQGPSRPGKRSRPLEGAAGRKLASLFGVSEREYRDGTLRLNIFSRWFGKQGKGDRFPLAAARRRASKLRRRLRGRRVVLLGRNVARAFGITVEYLRWIRGGFEAGVLPHPSGVNRWWNERRNRIAAQRFARGVWLKSGKA